MDCIKTKYKDIAEQHSSFTYTLLNNNCFDFVMNNFETEIDKNIIDNFLSTFGLTEDDYDEKQMWDKLQQTKKCDEYDYEVAYTELIS